MKLTFIGFQDTPDGKRLALFNDETGTTLCLKEALKRHGANVELIASTVFIECPDCGAQFLAETAIGFTRTIDLCDAWIFDADRHYNVRLANEMIARIQKLGCPNARANIYTLSDFCGYMEKTHKEKHSPFEFFLGRDGSNSTVEQKSGRRSK